MYAVFDTVTPICIFCRTLSYKWIFMCESSYCFQRVLAIAILSICLSVRPSHGWIRQKWCKLESPNLHHQLLRRL